MLFTQHINTLTASVDGIQAQIESLEAQLRTLELPRILLRNDCISEIKVISYY